MRFANWKCIKRDNGLQPIAFCFFPICFSCRFLSICTRCLYSPWTGMKNFGLIKVWINFSSSRYLPLWSTLKPRGWVSVGWKPSLLNTLPSSETLKTVIRLAVRSHFCWSLFVCSNNLTRRVRDYARKISYSQTVKDVFLFFSKPNGFSLWILEKISFLCLLVSAIKEK